MIINSIVLARGEVKGEEIVNNTAIIKNSVIEHYEANPLDLFTFFDPARLGIQVALDGQLVRVTKLEAGKPLARAGLQIGDVILSVGKGRPTSVEHFRTLLRRSELEGRTTFSIRRAEKVLDLAVAYGD